MEMRTDSRDRRRHTMLDEYEGKKIESITLNETVQIFRTLGLQASEAKLGSGIEQGVYPFGVCINGENDKRRQFVVYKKLLDEWIDERATSR